MSWKKAESLMYLGMNMHMIREVEVMVPATRVVRAPGLADLADEDDAQLNDEEEVFSAAACCCAWAEANKADE